MKIPVLFVLLGGGAFRVEKRKFWCVHFYPCLHCRLRKSQPEWGLASSINQPSQLINARDLGSIPMCLLPLELWISCHQCEISLCSLANGFCFTPCTTTPNSVEYVLWLMVLYCWKTTRKSWVTFFFFYVNIQFFNWTWWGLCGFLLVVFYLAIFSPRIWAYISHSGWKELADFSSIFHIKCTLLQLDDGIFTLINRCF